VKLFQFIFGLLFSLLSFSATAGNNGLYFIFLQANNRDVSMKTEASKAELLHKQKLVALYRQGIVKTWGDVDKGGEILIIKVKDLPEAWKVIKSDPAVSAGLFSVEIFPLLIYNGHLCKATEPHSYQLIRLKANNDFSGDISKMLFINRIFMSKIFQNDKRVMLYGFFDKHNDGVIIVDAVSKADALSLIKKHPAVKAGQLTVKVTDLHNTEGAFCRRQ